MADVIIILVIMACVAAAIMYIVREKKKGVKCIGCPESGTCPYSSTGGCHCRNKETQKEVT